MGDTCVAQLGGLVSADGTCKFSCTCAIAGECSRTVANRAQTNDFAAA